MPPTYWSGSSARDLAGGDPTGELLPDVPIRAEVVSRRRGVVSGTRHAAAIFGMRRCDTSIVVPDGEVVEAGGTVMGVRGRAADVLAPGEDSAEPAVPHERNSHHIQGLGVPAAPRRQAPVHQEDGPGPEGV